MEQAALAFLPGITEETEYQEYVKLLLGVGVFVGVTTSLLAAGVPSILPHLFTPDQRLWPIMKTMAPQVNTPLFCFVHDIVHRCCWCYLTSIVEVVPSTCLIHIPGCYDSPVL